MNPAITNLYDTFFTMYPHINKVAALDVETTGFSNSDRVVEIGLAGFEYDGICPNFFSFSSFINPHMAMPYEASNVNKITDDMLVDAPEDITVFDQLDKYLNNTKIILMHNAKFDTRMLRHNYHRAGMDFNKYETNIRCTLELSKSSKLPISSMKLNEIANHFGYKNEQEHRALSDAVTTLYIYGRLRTQ